MFWVHKGSDFGGELFGSYDSAEEAAQAIARLALEAFKLNDGVQRSYTIVQARSKAAAERWVEENLCN